MSFAKEILDFYHHLEPPSLPDGVEALLPFRDPEVRGYMEQFYLRFYNDDHPRILLFGINPGRLGAGKTGVGFTDPIRLREECGIEHNLEMKPEPSSVFMYEMIRQFGGPEKFFRYFHFTSVSPIGFIRNGINFNYYDAPDLLVAMDSLIRDSIAQQVHHPVNKGTAFSIGKGKNIKYLTGLNKQHQWFDSLKTLPHPRWVVQYQHKNMQNHIDHYLKELNDLIPQ